MTPGEDNTKMNFSWQSSYKSCKAEIEVGTKQDMSDAQKLDVDSRFNIFCFEYTHEATASELEADTTYYYKYYADKVWSEFTRSLRLLPKAQRFSLFRTVR